MESIGSRFKELRKKYNMSQKIFSEQIGISQGSLSDIEKGKTKPSLETVVSLSKQYGISTDWILTGHFTNEIHNQDYGLMSSLLNKFFNNFAEFISTLSSDEKAFIYKFIKLDEIEKTEILNKLTEHISQNVKQD